MKTEFIETGKIVNVRGVKGEVKAEAWSDTPEGLDSYAFFYIKSKTGMEELSKQYLKVQSPMVIIKFKNIDTVEDALLLKNKVLYVKKSDMPPLPEGKHYLFELLGMKVCLPNGEILGKVKEVMQTGANDVYIVSNGEKEYLLPAIPDVIKTIDKEKEEIHITPLPGLLE